MPPKPKTVPGPSRLSQILAGLTSNPRLDLGTLRSIKLTLDAKNDHFGARHFVKEQLPRIRYANPRLNIEVTKMPNSTTDGREPEMLIKFDNGQECTLNLRSKQSTTIVEGLMEVAGGASWKQWKAEAMASGFPLIPGEEGQTRPAKPSSWKKPSKKARALPPNLLTINRVGERPAMNVAELPGLKTGAAAVLP